MKKISFISGLLMVVMLLLFLTGKLDFNNSLRESIASGNRLYTLEKYDESLEVYQKALEKNLGDKILNYNMGQTSYQLNNYEQAIDYYGKASDEVDKYLNLGNCNYKLGDESNDMNQKMECYNKALEAYKDGMIVFPEDIQLKYNYEFVKSKIDELNKDNQNQQDDKNQQDNNDKQQDNKENNQDNQDGQQSNQENENNKENKGNKDNRDNKQQNQDEQNSESSNNDKDNNSDSEDKKQEEEQGSEQSGNQEKDKDEEKKNQNKLEKGDNSNDEQGGSAKGEDSTETESTDQGVMQVLEMLERQEENSLKNNQQVKNSGKEEKYDW
jgi:Ca-activated chloride channel family protein